MGTETARPDRGIAAVAAAQHGVVTTAQLIQAGLGSKAIASRAEKGQLHRIHQGVYAVGHPGLSVQGELMSAVLACRSPDRGAFVSHQSAAVMLRLLPPSPGPIEVTVRGYGGRMRRAGVRIHRSETLDEDKTAIQSGIPLTTAARTISDLLRAPRRVRLSDAQLRHAIRQAGILGHSLGANVIMDGTRSELERRFLALCRAHRIPKPAVNATVAGIEVDFHWPDRNLIVETDGFAFHRGPRAFEEDRQRDVRLRLSGYEVIRLTYGQVTKESKLVLKLLKRHFNPAGLADFVP